MTTAYIYESDRTGSCIWRMSTCSSSQVFMARRLAYTQYLLVLPGRTTTWIAHYGKTIGDRDSPQTHSIEYSLRQWPALRSVTTVPVSLASRGRPQRSPLRAE